VSEWEALVSSESRFRATRARAERRTERRLIGATERHGTARTRASTDPERHSGSVDAEPVVRLPEITDAQEIARTMTDSWRVGYRGLLSDAVLDLLDETRSTTQWTGWLRDGYENAGLRAEIRVATDATGRVVGISTFGADRDLRDDAHRGEVWALYVAPSHWGRGYGSALLRNAEDALAASGRRDLTLWVLEGNDQARRFYQRAGWRDDDCMKPFGDSGLSEVRYRKPV
jgi:ribosomal protein S18 acetylase RimI-like enzyme